jgi:hypothetical protein
VPEVNRIVEQVGPALDRVICEWLGQPLHRELWRSSTREVPGEIAVLVRRRGDFVRDGYGRLEQIP